MKRATFILNPLPVYASDTETFIIRTHKDFVGLLKLITKHGRVAVDLESTGLDPLLVDIVGISLSCEPGKGYYIPLGHLDTRTYKLFPDQLESGYVLPRLVEVLNSVQTFWHNAKFDWGLLNVKGYDVGTPFFDSLTGAWVLRSGKISERLGLKAQAKLHLGVNMQEITDLVSFDDNFTFAEVPIDLAASYAAADADMTLRLGLAQLEKLQDFGLAPGVWENEMSLIKTSSRMEIWGLPIDVDFLLPYKNSLDRYEEDLALFSAQQWGESVNLNSRVQVIEKLELLGADLSTLSRTPTGSPQVDDENLKSLLGTGSEELDRFIFLTLETRSVGKLNSTYVTGVLRKVHPLTGRVHPSWNAYGTVTSRYSSSEPNAQNIPAPQSGYQVEVRRGIAAPPGFLFLATDYAQAEIRVLAHVTGEQALIDIFRNADPNSLESDPHSVTAARMFGISLKEVDKTLRQIAKMVNFGTIYGIGAPGLARRLNALQEVVDRFGFINTNMAQNFLDSFFAAYPRVRLYGQYIEKMCRERGWVKTLQGFRREFDLLEPMNDSNKWRQYAMLREAGNLPIQGTVGGLIRFAMPLVDEAVRLLGGELSAQVHDEIVCLIPEDKIDFAANRITSILEGVADLRVPMVADATIGRTWYELKVEESYRKPAGLMLHEHISEFKERWF